MPNTLRILLPRESKPLSLLLLLLAALLFPEVLEADCPAYSDGSVEDSSIPLTVTAAPVLSTDVAPLYRAQCLGLGATLPTVVGDASIGYSVSYVALEEDVPSIGPGECYAISTSSSATSANTSASISRNDNDVDDSTNTCFSEEETVLYCVLQQQQLTFQCDSGMMLLNSQSPSRLTLPMTDGPSSSRIFELLGIATFSTTDTTTSPYYTVQADELETSLSWSVAAASSSGLLQWGLHCNASDTHGLVEPQDELTLCQCLASVSEQVEILECEADLRTIAPTAPPPTASPTTARPLFWGDTEEPTFVPTTTISDNDNDSPTSSIGEGGDGGEDMPVSSSSNNTSLNSGGVSILVLLGLGLTIPLL